MQTLSLLKALRLYGHNVVLLCYFEYENLIVEEFQKAGGNVRLLNLNRRIGFFALTNELRKVIREISPDVVHVQYIAPGALPILASRLAGVRIVFATVHQPYTKSHGWLAKIILWVTSWFTKKFIAVSQNAELSWFGTSHLFDEKIPLPEQHRHLTIHNSVDAELIQRIIEAVDVMNLKAKLFIREGVPVIGAVSRLRYEKGIDILIESFNHLTGEDSEPHLLLVGSGPDENLLKKTVEDYGLEKKVTFYGEADWEKAMQLIAIMDIVVVPSRYEGFGLTAAEAMAAGKPVLASDTSGLKEVVANGETGILFPVDDYATVLKALQKLIKDPDLRKNLGDAGRKRVSEIFSFEIFTRKINALYSDSLLNSL